MLTNQSIIILQYIGWLLLSMCEEWHETQLKKQRVSRAGWLKMMDVKMTDQFVGHEIARHEITRQDIAGQEHAGHEHDGPKMTAWAWNCGRKSTVLTEITLQWSVQIFKSRPQHCNTLCIRDYLAYFFKNLALSNDETQRSSVESNLKPMPVLYRCVLKWANYFNLRHFFRIGVVTGYREGMLNLLNLFGLKRLPLLNQFHVLLFNALQIGPSFSRPAFSSPPAARVYLGWLTDRAMHRTPHNRTRCTTDRVRYVLSLNGMILCLRNYGSRHTGTICWLFIISWRNHFVEFINKENLI